MAVFRLLKVRTTSPVLMLKTCICSVGVVVMLLSPYFFASVGTK